MMTDTHVHQDHADELPTDRVDSPPGNPFVRTPAEQARAGKNIALWKTYLPDDCIETMIAMGWDLSD